MYKWVKAWKIACENSTHAVALYNDESEYSYIMAHVLHVVQLIDFVKLHVSCYKQSSHAAWTYF